jgi:serine/threonine-protein kinase RsbT
MSVLKHERLAIREQTDVVSVRHVVRALAAEQKFSVVEQTKIVTAASELARNTFLHGHGGVCVIELIENLGRRGLRLTFEDQGPGILDMQLAMKDGYTSAGGMGLGLGGAKRLMNEFEIVSKVGEGTRVTVTRWKT